MVRAAVLAAGLLAVLAPQADALGVFGEGTTALVSAAPGSDAPLSAPVGGTSDISLSDDGRYAVFTMSLPALAGTRDAQVWRKDLQTGALLLVSRAGGADGAVANASASARGISDDGTVVAFTSSATNLVGASTGGTTQLYTRSLSGTPTTALRSRTSGGTPADGGVGDAVLSGNGAVVAFTSRSTNLATTPGTRRQVYRQGLATIMGLPVTELISRSQASASTGSDGDARTPSISDDGTTVAFVSDATNLRAPADGDGVLDVYVRDGATLTDVTDYDQPALLPSVSGNGDYLTFLTSKALVPSADPDTQPTIYRTTIAGTGATVVDARNGSSGGGQLDDSGGRVVFASSASDLVAGDTNGRYDVFVRDVGAATTTRVGLRDDDTQADANVAGAATDATAAHVAFVTAAQLTADSDEQIARGYVRAVAAGTTTLASRPPGDVPYLIGDSGFESPTMTPDARQVASVARAPGLTGLQNAQIYVRDMVTGAVQVVSTAAGPLEPGTAYPRLAGISDDGTRVAFITDSTTLGVANPAHRSWLWVRDRAAGTTTLASPVSGGGGPAGDIASAQLSADGTRVLFQTDATGFVGEDTHGAQQLYVRDLQAGTTTLVSRAANGAVLAPTSLYGARMSDDASRVVFNTDADLVSAIPGTSPHLYVRDLAAQTTTIVDPPPGGTDPPGAEISDGRLSADGDRLAYATNTRLSDQEPPGDTAVDVYVRGLDDGSLTLANRTSAGVRVTGSVTVTGFSADGDAVGLLSLSPELGSERRFSVRYLATGETRTANVTRDGATYADGYNPSLVELDRDGGCALLYAGGQDGPFTPNPPSSAVWMRSVRGACPVVPPPAGPPAGGGGGGGLPGGVPVRDRTAPVLSKVSLSAKRFAVSAKATAVSAARRKARKTPRGTTVRFRLSEDARVTVTVRSVKKTKRKGRKTVTRRKTVGRLTRTHVRRGSRTLSFSGRIGKKALARGGYELVLRATDAAGNASKTKTLAFTVVSR
jgi:Tol biopolymer transport system component